MEFTQVKVGRTHTSRILLGYCPICGLLHPTLLTSDVCRRFAAAVSPDEETQAWRALKAAVIAVT